MTRTLLRLAALALVAATLSGCAAAISYRKGFEAAQAQRLGRGGRALPRGGPGRSRQARVPDRARARDARGGHCPRARRERTSRPRASSTRRCGSTSAPANTIRRTGSSPPKPPSSIADPRGDRGEPAAAEDRRDARAGAADDAGAGPEPGVARAARSAVHRQRPRPPEFHRRFHRHQHHLHQRLPRPAAVHGEADGRHARAGAAADPLGERALLQGDQRAHHPGDSRHRAEPGAVRRTGHPHVLPVARRSDGARAAAQHDHARAGRAAGAGLRRRTRRRTRSPSAHRRRWSRSSSG